MEALKAFILTTQIMAAASPAALGNYKLLDSACQSCAQIDQITTRHNSEMSSDARSNFALDVARVIRKMSLKGKPELEQRREIYFAINGSLQVLTDDFDSETVIRLMDLRAQAPKQFDYVFWRFPLGEQEKIVERMQAAKSDKIRPKAQIPKPREVE